MWRIWIVCRQREALLWLPTKITDGTEAPVRLFGMVGMNSDNALQIAGKCYQLSSILKRNRSDYYKA